MKADERRSKLESLNVLEAARMLLDSEHNWTKGCWHDGEGTPHECHCAGGATGAMVGLPSFHMGALKELEKQLQINKFGVCVPAWNDSPGRKHSDVLKLFDDAIERVCIELWPA